MAFSLQRADGSNTAGALSAAINIKPYQFAFGGDWASRLQLRVYPRCVLTTPELPACSTGVPVVSTTDLAAGTMSAVVPVDPDPTSANVPVATTTATAPASQTLAASAAVTPAATVLVVAAAASGPAGDYTASTLSPSWKWGTSGNTGAFTYDYNVPVPPSTGGDAPTVDLTYNSQSVDAETSVSNGQASWTGNGWDLNPGFIEQHFVSCAALTGDRFGTSDLCYPSAQEYTLSLPGASGEIVTDGTTMRLRDDPGWLITKVADAPSGNAVNQHWVVTDPKGTQYWFGYGSEPNSNLATNSRVNVPVFAETSASPCYSAAAAQSFCQEQWRWMLDRVVDRNGNETSLFWTKQSNYYRSAAAGAIEPYDTSAQISRIEYGFRAGSETGTAPAKVVFTSNYRCEGTSGGPDASCAAPTSASSAAAFPDVPADQLCTSTSCTNAAPTFFTTAALTQIATYYWNTVAGAYRQVTTVDLQYTFPATSGSNTIKLWLSNVTRSGVNGPGGAAGSAGDTVTLPEVHFGGSDLANNVNTDAADNPAYAYRVAWVDNEMGGELDIAYHTPDMCDLAYINTIDGKTHTVDQNTRDCFPVNDGTGYDWYNKYLVTQLVSRDLTDSASPDVTTTYTYTGSVLTGSAGGGTAAWHHDDDLVTPLGSQSWTDWRGYNTVTAVTGAGTGGQSESGKATTTKTTYYRGMNGDKQSGAAARTVSVTDSKGTTPDTNALAGMVREVRNLDGTTELGGTLTTYGFSLTTVTGPTGNSYLRHDAVMVRPTVVTTRTSRLSAGVWTSDWRENTISYAYYGSGATAGLVQYAHDLGDSISGRGDACQSYVYQTNTTKWLIDFPQVEQTRTGGCTGTTVAGKEYGYDTFGVGGGDTTGNATAVRAYRNSTTDVNQTNYSFDSYGRETGMRNPNGVASSGGLTTIGYADPSSTSYLLNVHTTAPSGDSTWASREPGAGNVVGSTDARGQVSTLDYDDLGRLIAVWTPDNPKAAGGNPTDAYNYEVSTNLGGEVKSRQERTAGAGDYLLSRAYYDGLGRPTQTQAPSPSNGNTVTVDTRYDDRGQPWRVSAPTLYADEDPGAEERILVDPAALPSATYTGYDALGRTISSTLKSNGNVYNDASGVGHVTTTAYYGDHSTTTPPVGGSTATYVDANGLTTSVVQNYTGGNVTTNHSYDPIGNLLTTSTDATGGSHTSSFAYDMAGELIGVYDDDTGHTSTSYDHDGNPVSSTDANNATVATVYDADNRETSLRVGTASGAVLSSWSYFGSTAPYAGLLQTSVSNGGTGAVYTQSNTTFDALNNPTTQTLNVQSGGTVAGGALDGTYTSTAARNQLGDLTSITSPALPGFSAETVNYSYDGTGDLTTVASSTTTYQKSATYNGIAEMTDRHLGDAAAISPLAEFTRDIVQNAADQSLQSVRTKAVASNQTFAYDSFTWDAAENRTTATDGVTSQTQCFHYDDLHRLTQAFTDATGCSAPQHTWGTASAPAYDLSYAYNGNSTFKTVTDNIANGTATYNYANATHPHAVTSVTGNTNPGSSPGASIAGTYTVDAAGQMVTSQNSSNTLTYNQLHQLSMSHFAAGTSHLDYDAAGDRILKVDADGSTTLYLFGEEIVENAAHTASTVNLYYKASGTTIAERSGAASPGTPYWVLGDDQASTSLVINATTGALVSRQRYLPFGALRATATGALPTTHSYLGQPLDATGLLYDNARYYNPALGLFTTPDPERNDPAALSVSPYAYGNSNPTTYEDPSGLSIFSDAENLASNVGSGVADFTVGAGEGVINGAVSTATLGNVSAGLDYCPYSSASGACAAGQVVGQVAVAVAIAVVPGGEVAEGVALTADVAEGAAAVADGAEAATAVTDATQALGEDSAAVENALGADETSGDPALTCKNGCSSSALDPAARRAPLRVGTKQSIQDAAPKTEDGDYIDPNTGQVIPQEGPYDYGHKPGYEWWRTQQTARDQGWTRQQVLDYENDPSHYQIEDPSANRSHAYEKPQ